MVRETDQSVVGAWPVSFSTSNGTSDSFQRIGSFEQFVWLTNSGIVLRYDVAIGNPVSYYAIKPFNKTHVDTYGCLLKFNVSSSFLLD